MLTKFFLDDEELVDEARAVLRSFQSGAIELLAPPPTYYEMPSSILKGVRRNRIEPGKAREVIDLFLDLPLVSLEFSGEQYRRLIPMSYDTAARLNRSYYDAIFVVTANLLGVPLLTADRPLYDAANSSYLAIWLGDLKLP